MSLEWGQLEKTVPSRDGIAQLLQTMGYPIISGKEQLLDSDVLFKQKDMRERILGSYKLFGKKAQWMHPISKQTFDFEATIMLFEVADEQTLRSRWPFEIARYVVRFGLRSAQGLFFFVAPDCPCFVVSAYTENLDVPGKIQVRRLVVDTDNVARTDLDSLKELLYANMTSITMIDRFKSALPYLKVGQAFFNEYHGLFQILSKRMYKVLKSYPEAYGCAQRLLGKVTFLYFLQRKGWLDNDRAYLKKRTIDLDGQELIEFLYELFDILNSEGIQNKAKGVIPYLNGSLFEKEPCSDSQLKQLMEASAPVVRDILSTFDGYNFTISESTPLDKEVAVDPELLGSLFESMLPEAERGDKGTFYTHQEEMLFMAKEALRAYLVNLPNALLQSQVFHLVHGTELGENERIEPKTAREIKDFLRQVKVLDPAVGSGGFLMAALQVILETRARLNGIIGTIEQVYDMKLETIENNLFGVDIENEAIELARLRLWLALVVDESISNVRPLPNLDYNLHQGDTLRIPEFEKKLRQTKIDIDHAIRGALLKNITSTREAYSKSHGKSKETIKMELENALRKLLELETGEPQPKAIPFSYQFFFADVMASGGFDLVLMNPPYIKQEDIGKLPGQNPKTYKNDVANDVELLTNNDFVPDKKSDISVYFHVRSLSLLKEKGTAVVIATNKWLDTRYGIHLQEYLLKNAALDFVFDSSYRAFSADVNTIITIFRNSKTSIFDNIARFVCFKIPFENVTDKLLLDIVHTTAEKLQLKEQYRLVAKTQKCLYEEGLVEDEENSERIKDKKRKKIKNGARKQKIKIYVGTKWGNLHLRAPLVYFEILDRAGDKLKPLGKLCEIDYGLKSGNIDFFVFNKTGTQNNNVIECQNGFGHKFLLEEEYGPAVLRDPEDITTYTLRCRDIPNRIFMCGKSRRELKGTCALRYINWGETSTEARSRSLRGEKKGKLIQISEVSSVSSRAEWYQIPEIEPAKIFLPKIVKNRHVIPLSDKSIFSTDNFYSIHCDKPIDLWLYLNSVIFRFFMELNGRWEGAGALQMMVYEYKQCPGFENLPEFNKKFKNLENFKSRLAYRFLNVIEQGPLEFEQLDRKELDDIVLELMGFSEKREREKTLEEIYKWLLERVEERLLKPKTAPESVAKGIRKKRNQTDLREFQ